MVKCMHADTTVDLSDNASEDDVQAAVRSLAVTLYAPWHGTPASDVQLSSFADGMTNRLYRATRRRQTSTGATFGVDSAAKRHDPHRTISRPSSELAESTSILIRVYGLKSELFIDR